MLRYLELAAADPVVGDGRGPAGPSLPQRKAIDRKVPMSKLARALMLGATLAAMNLAGMTTVAQAQATDEPNAKDARRPPTERQVGETWRKRPVTSQPTTMDAAVGQLLRERSSMPSGTPVQVPAPTRPAEPNGQPSWLLASLGGLDAALALITGLLVLAAKRAAHRARVGHPA
jgi:hypothetical protein